MEDSKKHFVIVAGETSGDQHAAHLVEALKKRDPSLRFSGLGGLKMQKAGVKIYFDLTKIAVVGFVEVLKHYGEIRKAFHLILKKIDETKPAAVILVDYPGFNLRLAKKLKAKGIKVIYYISPQVWAWKETRVQLIKQCVDRMIVLFEFERSFYEKHGMDVFFAGHPLIEQVKVSVPKETVLHSIGLTDFRMTIGLLPGSRQKEIEEHLQLMLDAAWILYKEFPMLQFLIVKAPTISRQVLDEKIKGFSMPVQITERNSYDAINACEMCMVSSGTATLEVAIMQKPMVVIYKTSFLTWLIAKNLVKIPDIGLVNVVAGKRIVPECVQYDATPQKIADELKNIFINEIKIAEIKEELKRVKDSLGGSGASARAAEEILKVV